MMAVTLAAAHLAVRVPLGLSSARAGRMPPLGVSRLQLHASITATPLPRPVSRLAPHAASGHAPAEKYRGVRGVSSVGIVLGQYANVLGFTGTVPILEYYTAVH